MVFSPDFVASDIGEAVDIIVRRVPALMKGLAAELEGVAGPISLVAAEGQSGRSLRAVLRMMPQAKERLVSQGKGQVSALRLDARDFADRFLKDSCL